MPRSRQVGPMHAQWEWVHWAPLLASLYSSAEYPMELAVWSRGYAPRGHGQFPQASWTCLAVPGEPEPFDVRDAEVTSHWCTTTQNLLRYDTATDTTTLEPVNGGPLIVWAPRDVDNWSAAHTSMARLATFNPTGRGLVPQVVNSLFPADVFRDSRLIQDGLGMRCKRGSILRNGRVGTIHPAWLSEHFGWFAPGVDPAVFGAPYLSPWADDLTDQNGAPHPGWQIRRVGVPGISFGTVAWNDYHGLDRVVQELDKCPGDEELVQMALMGDLPSSAYANHCDFLDFMEKNAPAPGTEYVDVR